MSAKNPLFTAFDTLNPTKNLHFKYLTVSRSGFCVQLYAKYTNIAYTYRPRLLTLDRSNKTFYTTNRILSSSFGGPYGNVISNSYHLSAIKQPKVRKNEYFDPN